MPIGAPGVEQFRDAIIELRNQHIIAAMAPLMDFRGEIVGNDEFKSRATVDTTTQLHFMTHLQQCDAWRRVVTYAPNRDSLADRIKAAIDTAKVIGRGDLLAGAPADAPLVPDIRPFGADEVQSAPGGIKQLPWALDGTDPNIPLNSKLNFRSNNGLLLLQAVDLAIVGWTRLESRFATRFITVGDSMRMYGHYVQILEYLLLFAGDKNRVDFAVGVRPTEEPRGAAVSPNMITEVAGTSGIAPTK